MNVVNSFYVSRLKKAHSSELFPDRSTFTQPDPVIVNKNDSSLDEWEVEEVIGKRTRHKRIEYLVKWLNCGSEENSWEPVSNLSNSTEKVRQFEESETEINNRNNNKNRNKTQVNSIRVLTAITPVSNPHRIEQSLQCSARINKGTGRQCRNKTRRSEMCQPHLQSTSNLHIKQSNIRSAGLGLFTGRAPVERNKVITPYTGQISKSAINGNYVLKCTKNHFINANRSVDN